MTPPLPLATLKALALCVQQSSCRADQIAADCPSIPVGSVLIMLERAEKGKLYIEHGRAVLDYTRGRRKAGWN